MNGSTCIADTPCRTCPSLTWGLVDVVAVARAVQDITSRPAASPSALALSCDRVCDSLVRLVTPPKPDASYMTITGPGSTTPWRPAPPGPPYANGSHGDRCLPTS
jgi:hypothetical protein